MSCSYAAGITAQKQRDVRVINDFPAYLLFDPGTGVLDKVLERVLEQQKHDQHSQ